MSWVGNCFACFTEGEPDGCPICGRKTMNENVPAVESTYGRDRHEWNLLVRRPFYMNLRLGLTQNALWIGGGSTFRNVFNRFPWRNALGGWGRAKPHGEQKPSTA